MFTYLKMKKNEWIVKSMAYSAIIALIDSQNGALVLLQKMYSALKDVSADDLQKELIDRLAEIIHSENKNADN